MTNEAYKKILLLLERRSGNEKSEWSEEEQRLVKELAIEFRRTKLYQESQRAYIEEIEKFKKMKAEDVFIEMEKKILYATTGIHAEGAIILIIPILDEILEKERKRK